MSEFPEAKNWKMLIGGQWVDAADGDTTDVITPIDRNVVIAKVPNGKEADADRAVKAARKAFPSGRLFRSKNARRSFWPVPMRSKPLRRSSPS